MSHECRACWWACWWQHGRGTAAAPVMAGMACKRARAPAAQWWSWAWPTRRGCSSSGSRRRRRSWPDGRTADGHPAHGSGSHLCSYLHAAWPAGTCCMAAGACRAALTGSELREHTCLGRACMLQGWRDRHPLSLSVKGCGYSARLPCPHGWLGESSMLVFWQGVIICMQQHAVCDDMPPLSRGGVVRITLKAVRYHM